ncbi:MAG TPA: EthD domain-containing protein [Myxococcota bacterium]|nr:EthD domain-containing protein [Myxococcota bacterium]
MVKLVFALRRLPHLSRAEFQRYWREQHAPLVLKHAKVLGIRRYVQLHTIETSINEALRTRGGPEAFDGVAEIWLDRAEVILTPDAARAGQELLEDEKKFIDLKLSPLWLAEEREIISL